MTDYKEALAKSKIVLIVLKKTSYNQEREAILGALKEIIPKFCYLTTNKPYHALAEEIQSSGDSIFFVDAVTKTVGDAPSVENCEFVEGPTALTDLSLAVSSAFTEHGSDGCLVDTVSTLSIYQDPNAVVKFVHNIVTKARVQDKSAVFLSLEEENPEFIKDISMFMDDVVNS